MGNLVAIQQEVVLFCPGAFLRIDPLNTGAQIAAVFFQEHRFHISICWLLYLVLVRPILKCGQQGSSPYLRRDFKLMERIQCLATRMVKGTRKLQCKDRLYIFALEPRRLPGELLSVFELFNNRYDLSQAKCSEAQAEQRSRGCNSKLRNDGEAFNLVEWFFIHKCQCSHAWHFEVAFYIDNYH